MRDGVDGPIGSEGAEALEAEPEGLNPTNVIELRTALEAQNAEMINRLRLIDKTPTPLLLLHNQVQVLIDFMFEGEDDARNAYETACLIRLHHQLRGQLEGFASQLTAP